MTPTRADLLRDVAGAIVASGYAAPVQPRRPHVSRKSQIEVLAHDPRLNSTACKSEMVTYVMATYSVSNINARRMLHLARKMREETKS